MIHVLTWETELFRLLCFYLKPGRDVSVLGHLAVCEITDAGCVVSVWLLRQ